MPLEIHLCHHFPPGNTDKLDQVLALLSQLQVQVQTQGEKIMATLADLQAGVNQESTAIGSLGTLITNLQTQLNAVLSGANLPPAAQAQVDAIFATMQSNLAALTSDLAANVPVTPPAPPTTLPGSTPTTPPAAKKP